MTRQSKGVTMSNFEREIFCIDSIPGIQFEGFHDGSDWNGFACPFFKKQVAERLQLVI